jgi:Na+/H+ antiporter NhaA
MVAGAAMALILALGVGGQGANDPAAMGPGPRIDATRVGVARGAETNAVAMPVPADDGSADTVRVRRRAVRLSEEYYTRAKIHKYSSYLMLPTFAFMYAGGQQLMTKGRNAPSWAVNGHGIAAGVVTGLFAVNTVTGALNWYETRDQSDGFAWRTTHAALMLASDLGFAVVGSLATPAENSASKRRLHKTLAVTSISAASVSYLMMLLPFGGK